MAIGSLDRSPSTIDNCAMERTNSSRLRLLCTLLTLVGILVLAGCAGVSSNTQPPPPPTGALAVSPTTLNFGNVAGGDSSSFTGTLSASKGGVTGFSSAGGGPG